MKVSVQVKDRAEGTALQAGLEDPAVKAFVVLMGIMSKLPSDRSRNRVLTYVADHLAEQNEQPEA